MIKKVNKIIKHQITSGKTMEVVCGEIGLDCRTIFNIRVGKPCSDTTSEKINNFIEKEGL